MRPKSQLFVASAIAALVGWYLFPFLSTVGTLYAGRLIPASQVLLATGLRGQAFYQTLHLYDFALWVTFAIPTALVVILLKPRHLILYTALATVPFFIWITWGLDSPSLIGQYALLFLGAPSAAVLLLALIERRLRPNNSFKPSPLRGLGRAP